ncbi:MAG: hypothetical protein K940chlam7_01934 [Chlamydiae bacterium]|nr:hypothetical protein [Chlamydiota bacterium]
MKQKEKKTQQFRDPRTKLRAALSTLEKFTSQSIIEPIAHIYRYPKSEPRFRKIIHFAKSFITGAFSEKARKQNEREKGKVEEDIRNAIDDIKRYHPLICQKRSSEEKILAHRALETIQNFNHIVEDGQQDTSDWRKRLLRFLSKRNRPSFAKTHKVEISSPKQFSSKGTENASSALNKVAAFVEKNELTKNITEREVDAFRMKAISLIQSHGIIFPSISEAFSSVRESPIYTTISRDATQSVLPASSVIQLEQTLSPFPGETIILRGSFKRDTNAITSSTPISDSFELDIESIQTGFPYPAQHTGWSLSDPLIPSLPHRTEGLLKLSTLLREKNIVAQALLKRESIITKASECLALKKEAAEEHREEFLTLHKELCLSILSNTQEAKNAENVLSNYFAWLNNQPTALTSIALGYHDLNQRFILHPFEALNRAWINQTNPELLNDDPKRCFTAAQKILHTSLTSTLEELKQNPNYPQELSAFLFLVGNTLGNASHNIILQYFSEVIEFAPPQLSNFEKKIQSAAFFQLETFLTELNHSHPKHPYETLKQQLHSDTQLFSRQGKLHPLIKELDSYYTKRFLKTGGGRLERG